MARRTWFVVCVTTPFTAIAGLAWADIEGSRHDFSNAKWSSDTTCNACHTPQREDPPTAVPQWDKNADLTRRFGSPVTGVPSVGAGTRVCLRCHDGTLAGDSGGGATTPRFANTLHPGFSEASHGATDHPVDVDYPQTDPGFHPITVVLSKGTVRLPDGKVQCTSCHDPHSGSEREHMLVAGNEASALCLTCHNK